MGKNSIFSRDVSIGIILLLVLALIGTSAELVIFSQELKNKNADNERLVDIINRSNDQLASLFAQRSALQSKINEMNETLNLKKTEYWLLNQTVSQPKGSYSNWNFSAAYAGFVWLKVEASNSTATYMEVKYNSYGVIYDTKYYVGVAGFAPFPILPGIIELRVGNTNLAGGALETVTALYCY